MIDNVDWRYAILLLALVLPGCGGDNGEEPGTVFDPPSWVLDLGDGSVGGAGSGSGSATVQETFRGVKATIPGVAEPLIVAETNVVATETQLTRTLTANGTADDGDTVITIQFSVLQTASAPQRFTLVATPPATNDQANLTYSEVIVGGVANPLTAVIDGELDLERWTDIQARGTFAANIILADGQARAVSDGIIDVRF
ncbi:MAG: hypothetical protein D6761_02190 [Candidatus Dadabacteria bacterium]|nr:MAG: hypothetical protein D6761_02190 [Candidatus Dadabacteria bacterium]